MLLDPAFITELEALRRRLDPRVSSRGLGERIARRAGSSAEFHEHRAYAPGDDTRRLDWLAFARSGQPVLALFRAEEDAIVRLLVDLSAPQAFGTPTKAEAAQRLAAAVGYLALSAGQRVQALVARADAAHPERSPLAVVGPVRRGRSSAPALLRDLDAGPPAGALSLGRSVEHLLVHGRTPGVLVVLSDFLTREPIEEALDRARAAGHQLTLVQVVAREELDPLIGALGQEAKPGTQAPGDPGAARLLEGDITLEDAETGETVELSLDPQALDSYARAFVAHAERLRGWARRRGAVYLQHTTDEPLIAAVRSMLEA